MLGFSSISETPISTLPSSANAGVSTSGGGGLAGWMARRATRRYPSRRSHESAAEVMPVARQALEIIEPPAQPAQPSPPTAEHLAAERALLQAVSRPVEAPVAVAPATAPTPGPALETVEQLLREPNGPTADELAKRERHRVMQVAVLAYIAMWRN